MKPGRRPKPTALKILQGNPGCRPLNKNDPSLRLSVEAPECPKWLDARAKEEWERIVPIAMRMRVLTIADRAMLARFCECESLIQQLHKRIYETPDGEAQLLYKAPNGFVLPNPLIAEKNKLVALQARLADSFGFNPSARVRLEAAPEPQQDRGSRWARFA